MDGREAQHEPVVADFLESGSAEALKATLDRVRTRFSGTIDSLTLGPEATALPVGVLVLDADLRCVDQNGALMALVGAHSSVLRGSGWLDLIDGAHREGMWAELMRVVVMHGTSETWVPIATGRGTRWLHMRAEAVGSPDALHGVLCVVDDPTTRNGDPITADNALVDGETGLLRRATLVELVDRAVAADPETRLAAIHIDINGLADVASTHGSVMRTELRNSIAQRLRRVVRRDDLAGRVGDNSLVLLCEVEDRLDAVVIAERALAVLGKPHTIMGMALETSVTAGISVIDASKFDTATIASPGTALLDEARAAGVTASAMRPGSIEVRSAAQLRDRINGTFDINDVLATDSIETKLVQALDAGELSVRYIPEALSGTLSIGGFLANAWWNDDDHGPVNVSAVLRGMASDPSICIQVETWLVQEALNVTGKWCAEFAEGTPLTMSVPVSTHTLTDPGFVEFVLHELKIAGVDPINLVIEITESELTPLTPALTDAVTALATAGVDVAISPFRGMLAVADLERLPVTMAVVNRSSFISPDAEPGARDPERGEALQQAVIRAAVSLGLVVVADEVDSGAQVEKLPMLGVARVRGSQVCTPLTAHAARGLLRQRNS